MVNMPRPCENSCVGAALFFALLSPTTASRFLSFTAAAAAVGGVPVHADAAAAEDTPGEDDGKELLAVEEEMAGLVVRLSS